MLKMWSILPILALLALLALLPACGAGPGDFVPAGEDYFPPPESAGGWRKNTDPDFVRSLGLDPEKLEEFGRFNLELPNSNWEPYSGYKAALVIKDGWIVGEWYNVPEAEQFRSYISSNGKSFAISCFGIMARDSRAGKLDVKIDEQSRVYDPRWLPEGFPLSDPRKADIIFEQVFRHTSGICPERDNSGESLERGRDKWTDYVDWVTGHDPQWPVTGKLFFPPGRPEQWAGRESWGMVSGGYSSVAFAHLGLVFRNVYGRPAHEFLWERLLRPIGFGGIEFHAAPEDSVQWFSAGGLRVSPRDYARFAWFLLNDGRWEEEQLVPEDWIPHFRKEALYPNILSNAGGYFGEQYPADMFRIAGSGLNWAFIVPSQRLIALRVARGHNAMWDEVQSEFLRRVFGALVEPGSALRP